MQPDHFLVQGGIACSISIHTKKGLAQFTDLNCSAIHQKLTGDNWWYVISTPPVETLQIMTR